MIENRSKYLQAILLKDEIEYFHSTLSLEKPLFFFRNLKYNIMSLYLLKEVINKNSKKLKDNLDFKTLKKSINNELNFINHIRNKICGHFDENLMLKAAQWQPQIFFDQNKNQDFKVLLCYTSIFESAINSYVDLNGNNKMYDYEIDLNLYKYRTLFIETIYKLNNTGLKILKIIIKTLENENIYFSEDRLFEESKIAGHTNFDLANIKTLDTSEIIENKNDLISDDFIKSLNFRKREDLELLIKKIEEINKETKNNES